jgi:hypothetical protein
MVTLEIKMKVEGKNTLTNWRQYKRHKWSGYKKKVMQGLQRVLFELEEIPQYEKAKMTFTRVAPRGLDYDGLVYGGYLFLDALQTLNVIKNDNADHLLCTYHSQKGEPKEYKLIITLEEWDGEMEE